MSTAAARRPWLLSLAAVAVLAAVVAAANAVDWYGHPCAEVLVDPDGVVSGIGSPSWAGTRQGLKFPDRIVAVDGVPFATAPTEPGRYVGDRFDEAVARAFD